MIDVVDQHIHKPHAALQPSGGSPLSSGQIQTGARQSHAFGGLGVVVGSGGGGGGASVVPGGGGACVVAGGGGGGACVVSGGGDACVVWGGGGGGGVVIAGVMEDVGVVGVVGWQVHRGQDESVVVPQRGGSPSSSGQTQVGARQPHMPDVVIGGSTIEMVPELFV